jgi:hypothetical protein
VALLAPSEAGAALVGPGAGELRRLLPWEAAAIGGLFTDAGPSAALRETLGGFDAVVVYTRNPDLARSLGGAVPRLVVHDPRPSVASEHAADWLARPVASLGVPCCGGTADSPGDRRRGGGGRRARPRSSRALPGRPSRQRLAVQELACRPLRAVAGRDRRQRFLLVEGPADAEAVAALRVRRGALTARGLTPRVLGAALAHAGAFVGNDSGVTHLAAAWGAPTVALFGPTDPGVWSPVGRG